MGTRIKINYIDLHKGDSLFIRFAGSCEHSLSIAWGEKGELPTVLGPFNRKSKIFEVSVYGMKMCPTENENKGD